MRVSLVGLITLLTILQSCKKLDESDPLAVLTKYQELKNDQNFDAAYEYISSDSKKYATSGEYIKYYEKPDSLIPQKTAINTVVSVDLDNNSPSYKRFKTKGYVITHAGDSINFQVYTTLKNENGKWRIVWNNILTQQAQQSYNKGDYDGSLKLLGTATILDPYDGDAYEQIGWCYMRDNTKGDERKDQIMKNYKYALSLEPDQSSHYNAMASYYSITNMVDLQIDSYNKGLEMSLNENDNSYLYANLAQCYLDKYQTEKAVEYLKKAINCDPDDAFAYYKYGIILNDQGKYEEAKQQYEKALSLTPMENGLQSGLYYVYSKLCLKQYEYQKAKDYVLKALEMDPNNEYYQDLYKRINTHASGNEF